MSARNKRELPEILRQKRPVGTSDHGPRVTTGPRYRRGGMARDTTSGRQMYDSSDSIFIRIVHSRMISPRVGQSSFLVSAVARPNGADQCRCLSTKNLTPLPWYRSVDLFLGLFFWTVPLLLCWPTTTTLRPRPRAAVSGGAARRWQISGVQAPARGAKASGHQQRDPTVSWSAAHWPRIAGVMC